MSEKELETLHLLSGEYKTELNRFYKGRKKWTPANEKIIVSFMPGNVIKYKVKEGDKVKKGDTLLTFSAMKMNNVISSPCDGVIRKLGAAPGENVPKNALLIELE